MERWPHFTYRDWSNFSNKYAMHTQSHNWIYLSVMILEMVLKDGHILLIVIDLILATSMQCTHKAIIGYTYLL